MRLVSTLILGLLEGLTEFLPISSTGHLLLAEHWLGKRSDLFNVGIQTGAILAVVLIYWHRLCELLSFHRDADRRAELVKILCSFLVTAVLGLVAKLVGVELPETVFPVALVVLLGGLAILAVEKWWHGAIVRQDVTWGVVLAVGVAQAIAGIFPGTSRSGAAIVAALAVGLTDRRKGAEFAFLVGIPTMFAASGYELLKALRAGAPLEENWGELVLAGVVAAVVGFVAVRWLLHFLVAHTLVPFAWYRLLLGSLLLVLLASGQLRNRAARALRTEPRSCTTPSTSIQIASPSRLKAIPERLVPMAKSARHDADRSLCSCRHLPSKPVQKSTPRRLA